MNDGNKRTKTSREVLLWVALFVISLVAAPLVNKATERISDPLATLGGEGIGEDVNFSRQSASGSQKPS